MSYFDSNKLKGVIALAAIAIVGTFLLFSLWKFIPAFLGSVIFYIIFTPFTNYLVNKKKVKRVWAVIITLILSFWLLLIPISGLTWLLIYKISSMISGIENVSQYLESFNNLIKNKIGFNILTPDSLEKLKTSLTGFIPRLLGGTFDIAVNILIMFFILYYLLDNETNMGEKIAEVLPYEKKDSELFTKELISQTYVNAIAAPLLAIMQGGLSALGFGLFGIKDPLFWGVICGLVSFLPFVGTPMIWVPAGIIQFYTGAHWQGTGLLIYGLVVIVGSDHFFRLAIQNKMAHVHPLITLFGIIIGVHWFGMPGFIFGPLLISYFLIMIKIYKNEQKQKIVI